MPRSQPKQPSSEALQRKNTTYDLSRKARMPGGSTESLPRFSRRFRLGLRILAVIVSVAFGYFALVLLTPTFGRLVGYADAQPPLAVLHDGPPSPAYELEHIHEQAILTFAKLPGLERQYWPQPRLIHERENCWLVEFQKKTPIYSLLGFRQTYPSTGPAMSLTITKADMKLRYGRWCD